MPNSTGSEPAIKPDAVAPRADRPPRDLLNDDLSALETALELLRRDRWPVVLHPPGVTIETKEGPKVTTGKEPIGLAWGKRRPTEAGLRKLFALHPGAGVGLVLGPNGGLIDVEIDGPEGEDSLATLFGGEIGETLGCSSRRGPHRFYRWDDRLAEIDPQHRAKLTLPGLPGLEIRLGQDKQAQSACPPTVGEDGIRRAWTGCEDIAPLPEAALRFLAEALAVPRASGAGEREATRHAGPAAAWFRKALESEAGKVATARENHRHKTLLAAARTLGGMLHHGYLDEADVVADLTHAGLRAGLPEGEVCSTVRDGLAYGKDAPLSWPDKLAAPNGRDNHSQTRVEANSDGGSADEDEEIVDRWPRIDQAALYGLVWEVVEAIEPHTEADPIAMLVQLLLGFANLIGRRAHFAVGATWHHLNLFLALVGTTSMGRKGTSWEDAKWALKQFDPEWAKDRIERGLVSGEGLIWHVRDPVYKVEAIKDRSGRLTGETQTVLVDEGVADKRLLVVESEFASTLKAMNRQNNTLPDVLKQAWDGGDLGTMAKNSKDRASGAHISIIGHVTRADIAKHLSREDCSNGFANRFLWLMARKSKELPDGGDFACEEFTRAWEPVKDRLGQAIEFGRSASLLRRDRVANEMWRAAYGKLSEGKPGLLGAVLGRAEPQVMRLACIYALLDRTTAVGPRHLAAALALWRYCEASARYIFGDSLGYPDAEKFLAALRAAPAGLSRSDIYGIFHKKKPKAEINAMLGEFLSEGLAHKTKDPSEGGRRAERWHAGKGTAND